MQWLADNDYEQDPDAVPIFQEYIDEGYLFAAFRLTHDAGLDEIHPITLVFDNTEPCIPLRLTKIAAADDMEVRAFFLGNARTVPTNYRHVLINLLEIDWDSGDKNFSYKNALSNAVDEFGAEGRAFVTEYAGDSGVVSSSGLLGPLWDSSAFPGLDATLAIDVLTGQDLVECLPGEDCIFSHLLLPGLLNQYLPVPDGLESGDYWGCLSCYEDLIDQGAWDGQAFADDLQERIIEPGIRAEGLLDTWPYLTRLYTLISPHEMTEDPTFHTNDLLPNVDNVNLVSRVSYSCLGFNRYTFEDGRIVYKWFGDTWSQLPPMPFSEKIENIPLQGAPQVIVDNTPIIDQKLAQWHAAQGLPPPPPTTTDSDTSGVDTDTNPNTDTDTDTTGIDTGIDSAGTDPGTGGVTGTAGPDTDTGGPDSGATDSEGCGCQSQPGTGSAVSLLLLSLLGFSRRRVTE